MYFSYGRIVCCNILFVRYDHWWLSLSRTINFSLGVVLILHSRFEPVSLLCFALAKPERSLCAIMSGGRRWLCPRSSRRRCRLERTRTRTRSSIGSGSRRLWPLLSLAAAAMCKRSPLQLSKRAPSFAIMLAATTVRDAA